MCCAVFLVCLSIATYHTCQLWMHSEHIYMSKTIESPAKCDMGAVIKFLYSEQATRNVVIRHCPSWQCLVAHCSCNKEAPAVFSMGRVWSPPYSLDVAPLDFHLFPHMKRCLGGQHFGTDNEMQPSIEKWLKAQRTGFYDEGIVKLVPLYEKCLC